MFEIDDAKVAREARSWRSRLPAGTLDEHLDPAFRSEARIRLDGPDAVLVVDDGPEERHASYLDAMTAAIYLANHRKEVVRAEAFERAGLSNDDWSWSGTSFRSLYDEAETIAMLREGYEPRLGSVALSVVPTALEAVAVLASTPHLSSKDLHDIENVAEGTTYHQDPEAYPDLVARGLLLHRGYGMFRVTGAGREAYDADPRTMPLALRGMVHDRLVDGVRRDHARRLAEGEVQTLEPDASLAADLVNLYLSGSGRSGGGNCAPLMQALQDGCDLEPGIATQDPYDAVLVASGGSLSRRTVVATFGIERSPEVPMWLVEAPRLFAHAVADARDDMVEALESVGPVFGR